MKIRIEALGSVIGDSGQILEGGNFYKVTAVTAMALIRAKKARIAETSLLKVRILRDDILHGMRRGEVVEMPVSGVEKLIGEYKAEFFYTEGGDEGSPKIKILITEDTIAEVDGKMGTCVQSGKTYYLKPSDAAILISMGKAKFPDLTETVEVKFNMATVFKGSSFQTNNIAKFPVSDAEELIRRGVVEPVSLIEESQEAQEIKEKKLFLKRF